MVKNDANSLYPGEPVSKDEIRVTAIGTGMPFARRKQASAGWLIELGNGEKFIFDISSIDSIIDR